MKLLVTGGLGFIGSNFILHVLKNNPDFEITNLDACKYGSNEMNLSEIENLQNYRFVNGNISDKSIMNKLIIENDVIINFAAESFVDRSISQAQPFLDSNITGVFTILEILKETKKKLIHISTDEVFGSLENETANEKFRFNPSSPYSATKASSELLINSYSLTYGCDCIITRCTNNYGPRQFPEKLIPKVIYLATQNKKIPVYGNGKNIRDWIFVEDHCNAILKVLENGKSNESYNISSDSEIDNITIVKTILEMMGKNSDLIEFVEDRPGHDFRYSLDSSKIMKEIGWKNKTSFEEGIKQTIQWYENNSKWWEKISHFTFENTPWKN
ncbi:dTDP-glucose 4,6-dehydratase [Nitrosopumilus adriaticus]|uniref:dTDP-glucose 4,6-dehydratase n=1 Tax=Nitrosopumilus adriaticus TaxID=1580092 RepID=UPI00352CBF70